ncbi:Uncharacterised protein [Capnocytophaga ochracea]|uniref:Uncharacterized protein n=1 Tax=Capnocytophaga ochracea TaxID=1018 RepID=A0A2X2R9G0_CAPOC|nr:Uncharacterised protein [Capnocytophaga ochracea]
MTIMQQYLLIDMAALMLKIHQVEEQDLMEKVFLWDF